MVSIAVVPYTAEHYPHPHGSLEFHPNVRFVVTFDRLPAHSTTPFSAISPSVVFGRPLRARGLPGQGLELGVGYFVIAHHVTYTQNRGYPQKGTETVLVRDCRRSD